MFGKTWITKSVTHFVIRDTVGYSRLLRCNQTFLDNSCSLKKKYEVQTYFSSVAAALKSFACYIFSMIVILQTLVRRKRTKWNCQKSCSLIAWFEKSIRRISCIISLDDRSAGIFFSKEFLHTLFSELLDVISLQAYHVVLNNPKKEPLPESAAYRRALQLLAAGLFLIGSAGKCRTYVTICVV